MPSRSMRNAATLADWSAPGGRMVSETPIEPSARCADATQGSATFIRVRSGTQARASRR